MRSVRFERFGDPTEVLQVVEVDPPQPRPAEVLVRLTARPIHPADLLTVRGHYGIRPRLPATPGLESAGTMAAVGSAVRAVQPGQRVIPLTSLDATGTWQEYIVVPETQLLLTPDRLADASAAQLIVNPLTAWLMLTQELSLAPGDWLLQTAAGSTIGRVVIQIGKLRDLKTINVVRRREAVAELKALGADEVICTADEDLAARVREITDGQGVTAALDAVGGETGGQVLRALAPGGVLLLYGGLSGKPVPVDAGRVIFRNLQVRGFWVSQWLKQALPEQRQPALAELLSLMAQGEIVPPVEATYDLADVREAARRAEQVGRHGKVLLLG